MVTAKQTALEISSGIVLIAILIVIHLYLIFHLAAAPAVTVTERQYSAARLLSESTPGGIFDKVASLSKVPSSDPATTRYQDADLGKTDISKPE